MRLKGYIISFNRPTCRCVSFVTKSSESSTTRIEKVSDFTRAALKSTEIDKDTVIVIRRVIQSSRSNETAVYVHFLKMFRTCRPRQAGRRAEVSCHAQQLFMCDRIYTGVGMSGQESFNGSEEKQWKREVKVKILYVPGECFSVSRVVHIDIHSQRPALFNREISRPMWGAVLVAFRYRALSIRGRPKAVRLT